MSAMFWRLNYKDSAIDGVLNKEHFTLEELLDVDEVIQECRGLNSKLVNFLSSVESIHALLNYALQVPGSSQGDAEGQEENESSSEAHRVKYPYVASELLSLDVNQIYEAILEDQQSCELLFNFLKSDSANSAISCGYFSKIMTAILVKKPAETIELMNTFGFVDQLLGSLQSLASVDLLLRLASLPEDPTSTVSESDMEWFVESDFLSKLLSQVSDMSAPDDCRVNAAAAICGLLQQLDPFGTSSFSTAVFSSNTAEQLLNSLADSVSTGDGASPLPNPVLTVLSQLLRRCQSKPVAAEGAEVSPAINTERVEIIAKCVHAKMDLLINAVVKRQAEGELTSNICTTEPVFGGARIKGMEVIAALCGLPAQDSSARAAVANVAQACLDLLPVYKWNSILHNIVAEICALAIKDEDIRAASGDGCMSLVRRCSEMYDSEVASSGKHRPSYFAQLILIGKVYSQELQSRSEEVPEGEDGLKQWLDGPVAEAISVEKRKLGGQVAPRATAMDSSSSSDDDRQDDNMYGWSSGANTDAANSQGNWAPFDLESDVQFDIVDGDFGDDIGNSGDDFGAGSGDFGGDSFDADTALETEPASTAVASDSGDAAKDQSVDDNSSSDSDKNDTAESSSEQVAPAQPEEQVETVVEDGDDAAGPAEDSTSNSESSNSAEANDPSEI